ncbi:adenosylcobinamide kinase/adenosylcobinamide-phosphate guanylyltransferase [Neorhizobium galegae]|uniref:bifunctional adenosylcobinamide kinase/adenosylcobinamide-phosphate guanylyltransferase n=1 Tax=Neorhizobium galegae TaxID=399 RepID=UPI001AE2A7C7|nr:bifunctional adenosylcobinamide kinase/adenosylcobinamide-phosphate guanylyltransferase [Neorhizobium galegae]MBP2549220.1 adenosylcobinamide kinase/adenosylcobinamide-phosphate guanylyltransferase [Neorhizobium galegae]
MAIEHSGKITFVLGGARSGKSRFAEGLATESGLQKHYVATGQAWDDEMRHRIAQHRADRGDGWVTHDVPIDLAAALTQIASPDRIVLVDCLTLWLTNLMMAERPVEEEARQMVASLDRLSGPVVFVSNEVGLGIVPENRMARQFRDYAGRLHQQLAAVSDTVFFIAAGLPLKMKG